MSDHEENPSVDDNPEFADTNVTRKPSLLSDMDNPEFPKPSRTVENVDTLTVYIPGRTEPLVLQNMSRVIIGRRDDEAGFYPTIDLVPYYGLMLGVSRQHAEMILEKGKCYIKDLNSANGTWLNQTKLEPDEVNLINNGDQIRLGRLLMAIFLSHEADVDTTPELGRYLITFRFPSQRKGMSPDDLVGLVGLYLKAAGDLQKLISSSGIVAPPDIMVYLIKMDKDKSHIHVEMSIDPRLLDYIQNKLSDFLKQTTDADAPILVDLAAQNFVSNFNLEHTDRVINPLRIIMNSHLMIVSTSFAGS